MQYICKMGPENEILATKNAVFLRISQKCVVYMNATPAHTSRAHLDPRSYLAHVRPHLGAYAYARTPAPGRAPAHLRTRIRTHAHACAHTHTHTRAHTPAHTRISKRIDTRKRFPIVSDIFYQQALTPVNASKNRKFWGSYIKEGGSYIKEGPSCIKGSCTKEEIKKAGYFSSPAFPNKSAVMFDSVNIQRIQ